MTATKPDVLASLPRLDRHQPKGQVRPSKVSRWRAIALIAVHVVVGLHVWHWLSSGETLTPVEPSEAMQAVEMGRVNAGFVLFLALIASTLLFGRWFCGWACHVVALQDLSAWLLNKLGIRPKPVRSRLLILAPWLVAFHMFAWPLVQQARGLRELPGMSQWELHLTTDDLWATFPGPIMAVGTFLVVGFLIVWWLGAKGFCTYGCPYGAFFAVADRVAPMTIKVNDDCEHCGHCTAVCSSNVRVHEEVARYGKVVDPGCMKCLDCVSVCPKDALSFGVAKPKPFAISQQRIRQRADFTWKEEVLMGVVAVVAVQFTWRRAWFGESVPFLMSVGLGVITAVFAMLFVRLLTRPDVSFQHWTWKVDGRRTRAGNLAFVGILAWLLLAAHTFVTQRRTAAATELAGHPILTKFYQPREFEPARAEAALAAVDEAAGWALCVDPRLREMRALLRGTVGRHADAETELRELHRLGFGLADEAKLALANYCMQKRQLDRAEQLLQEVVTNNPNNPPATFLLRRVQAMK